MDEAAVRAMIAWHKAMAAYVDAERAHVAAGERLKAAEGELARVVEARTHFAPIEGVSTPNAYAAAGAAPVDAAEEVKKIMERWASVPGGSAPNGGL
jgi:hypothetical protein